MSPRVYVRKFDWDEARRRHAAGEPLKWIARDIGVSVAAVWRVVDERHRARMNARASAFQVIGTGTCVDCGGGCTRYRVRCPRCAAIARATTVRETELQCTRCREWKSDDAFPHNRAGSRARRGRHDACRSCQTTIKREYRRKHREKANAYDREYKRRRRAQQVAA